MGYAEAIQRQTDIAAEGAEFLPHGLVQDTFRRGLPTKFNLKRKARVTIPGFTAIVAWEAGLVWSFRLDSP
jgi:hypothetical protein